MSAKWSEVSSKRREPKSQHKEEIFYLLENLNNGGCMRCMNKSCKINERHGLPYPDKICTFVQNPTYINGMEKCIKDSKLDFNGKIPFYTTCNYVNGKCRNCEEGRVKYISFNKEQVAVCYPVLEGIRNKVTVGMHIDIKMVMKGSKYEISLCPLNISKILPVLKSDKVAVDNLTADNFPSLVIEIKETPLLNGTESYLSKTKDDYVNISPNILVEINRPLRLSTNSENSSHEQVCQEFIEVKTVQEDTDEMKCELNKYILENLHLKREIIELKQENSQIKEKNMKEMYIIDHKYKYAECAENIRSISDRVSQQFFNTNYSDYVIAE